MIRTEFSRDNSKISLGDGSNQEEIRIRAELKHFTNHSIYILQNDKKYAKLPNG